MTPLACMTDEELIAVARANASAADELVRRGVYPAKSGIGVEARRMVEYYGALWHEYAQPHACWRCDGELRDLKNGPPFKIEIALVENDRCVEKMCPHCQAKWAR